jgi:hypothetical protein
VRTPHSLSLSYPCISLGACPSVTPRQPPRSAPSFQLVVEPPCPAFVPPCFCRNPRLCRRRAPTRELAGPWSLTSPRRLRNTAPRHRCVVRTIASASREPPPFMRVHVYART